MAIVFHSGMVEHFDHNAFTPILDTPFEEVGYFVLAFLTTRCIYRLDKCKSVFYKVEMVS
jgi:hypothetical protein